jgi:hypothetical protein
MNDDPFSEKEQVKRFGTEKSYRSIPAREEKKCRKCLHNDQRGEAGASFA